MLKHEEYNLVYLWLDCRLCHVGKSEHSLWYVYPDSLLWNSTDDI